jgi:O-antigen/teichoic acid export membrane protein
MQDMKARLARGAIWLGASRVIISLVGMISTIVLARILTPSDFGLVAIATTVLTILASLTELSLGAALVQRTTVTDHDLNAVWTLGVIRAALITLILSIAAGWVANFYNDQRLVAVLIVGTLSGAVGSLYNPKLMLLARDLQFKQQFVMQALQKVVALATSVTIALVYKSYWALILGGLGAALATTIYSYFLVPYRPRFRLRGSRSLFGFSIWLSLSQLIQMINWRADQLLIGYFVSKRDLGIYVVSDTLASIPTREATQPLTQALFPGFSKFKHDPARLRSTYVLAQTAIVMIAFPAGFGFSVVAAPTVQLALGNKWMAAIPIIQILSMMFAVQTLTAALQGMVMAIGQTRRLFMRDTRVFILHIPIILVGYWLGGFMGCVYARVISGLLNTLLNMDLAGRIMDLPFSTQLLSHWRTFVATAAMVGASVAITAVFPATTYAPALAGKIASGIATGGLVYLTLLYTLWRASGSPAGAEADALRFLAHLRERFKKQNGRSGAAHLTIGTDGRQ